MFNALKSKRFAVLLALLAVTLFFALPALAAEPVSFSLSVEPASLTEPGPVTVSLRVANTGDADLTEPVSLQDPDGQVVGSFGDGGQALIKQGEYVTAQQTYNVTQEQLNAGKLTYTLSYNQVDESGEVVVQTLAKSAEIAYTGTHVDLKVNRAIDPEVVRRDKAVSVQYELYNAGNVEIKNIRVRENSSVSGTSQTLASLAPGERKTIQFTATMGYSDMTSAGKVTYTAGDDTATISLPEVTIPRAIPNLELNNILSADQTSVTNGETVTLTLTIKNNGNITYSNITVTDAKYGELFTNLTLGPGETLVKEKQFTLSETTAFKYTITLPDNTGTTSTVTSNEIKVSVYDPSQVLMLNLMAEADTTTIASAPADVRFTLTVTNNSSFEAKNVLLSHGGTDIYTVSSLKPGESASVTRAFSVSQAGKFRFTASAKDALDNTVSFDSNEITLSYASRTAAPSMAPIVTVAPPVLVTAAPVDVLEPATVQLNQILRVAAMVLVPLFALVFILFVVSTVIRSKRRKNSESAYDHMDLGAKRDYNEPARYPSTIQEPENYVPALQEQELPMEKPSDAILKEEPKEEPKEERREERKEEHPAVASANSESGGFVLTRDDFASFTPTIKKNNEFSLDDFPAPAPQKPEEPTPEKPADPAPEQPADPAPETAPETPEAPVRHRRAGRRSEAPSEDE